VWLPNPSHCLYTFQCRGDEADPAVSRGPAKARIGYQWCKTCGARSVSWAAVRLRLPPMASAPLRGCWLRLQGPATIWTSRQSPDLAHGRPPTAPRLTRSAVARLRRPQAQPRLPSAHTALGAQLRRTTCWPRCSVRGMTCSSLTPPCCI